VQTFDKIKARLGPYLCFLALFFLVKGSADQKAENQNLPSVRLPVEFFKEKIKISCDDEEIRVEATYYLRNLSNGILFMTIKYPFPVDEHHPFPYQIKVENYRFWKDKSNIYWKMRLQPKEEKSIKILYKQRVYNKSATYIVSTTQYWGRPIEKADFVISVPIDWKKVKISYPTDKLEIRGNRKLYLIAQEKFFPTKEIVISWE